jgi:hypothetical protein
MPQATTSKHPNVFIFILPLSERRKGEALRPCNQILLLILHNKLSLTSLTNFPFACSSAARCKQQISFEVMQVTTGAASIISK